MILSQIIGLSLINLGNLTLMGCALQRANLAKILPDASYLMPAIELSVLLLISPPLSKPCL
jgi:hypothetical protein